MAGITLSDAETQLANWLTASTALTTSQSYTINGRTFTRADTGHVMSMIEYWDKKVIALTNGASIRVRQVIPSATSQSNQSF